ncbi:hypothetical protein Y032_0552g3329 [Ancylostoma ceylanicum]|uniref:Uncharacterized protein n=1 Tax=Ancylostoma ceylanicum TaxID=53326 RepID=A0A016WS43_9BILA|nr:hypothetical protein Y032_0552g3329 [Ancylostoma ceylanicum]
MLSLGLESLLRVTSKKNEIIEIYNSHPLPDFDILRDAYDGIVLLRIGEKRRKEDMVIEEDNVALGKSIAIFYFKCM